MNILQALPIDQAMPALLPTEPHALADLVEGASLSPVVLAGLWLYVDELEKAHVLVQDLDTPTGSAWHAIMHRREGDFWNSKYWWRRANGHPAFAGSGHEPSMFVDAVEKDGGLNSPLLLERQRLEWKVLFDWCVAQEGQL